MIDLITCAAMFIGFMSADIPEREPRHAMIAITMVSLFLLGMWRGSK